MPIKAKWPVGMASSRSRPELRGKRKGRPKNKGRPDGGLSRYTAAVVEEDGLDEIFDAPPSVDSSDVGSPGKRKRSKKAALTELGTWFPYPRDLPDWVKRDPKAIAILVTFADRARYDKPGPVRHGRYLVDCDIGQCVFGREELAKHLGITEREVRTRVKRLDSEGIATIDPTSETASQGTKVTLRGYKDFWTREKRKRPATRPAK